jgi:DNA-binding phage protein
LRGGDTQRPDGGRPYLGGDEAAGKALLRDVIDAKIGFEPLAAELGTAAKSLHRMLGSGGNPSTANFFAILRVLQKRAGVKLTVTTAWDQPPPTRRIYFAAARFFSYASNCSRYSSNPLRPISA